MSVWRRPAEESHLYPGLCVSDNRVTGSITLGCSRLPLWAFIHGVVLDGWDQAERWYDASEYGTADDVASFVVNLLEARGEFARLLLVIAEAERCERAASRRQSWWATKRHRKRVGDQLRRCLDVLEDR